MHDITFDNPSRLRYLTGLTDLILFDINLILASGFLAGRNAVFFHVLEPLELKLFCVGDIARNGT